jgi:hypothetical protein
MAKQQNKCYNCKFAGQQFKIFGKTHLHCKHPKFDDEIKNSPTFSPWDTLREFWHTCDDYKSKPTAP